MIVVTDQPWISREDARLADILTTIVQTRLGVPADPWDWRPASHCDLDRALALLDTLNQRQACRRRT